MIKTCIILMSSGLYYVGKTNNVSKFLDECRNKTHNGFFHQKKNLGTSKLVFSVKGDYVRQIRSFGGRKFMEMIAKYDPVLDGLEQALN